MKRISLISFVALLTLFVACNKEDVPVGPYNFGSISTTKYVSIGNSITAGMQSGALFETGQQYSYPNLIAGQLGVAFVQPLIPKPGTGALITLTSLTPPTLTTGAPTQTAPSNITYALPYDNLGIPGAVMGDAIDTSSISTRAQVRGNPFYLYIMRNQAAFGSSVIGQAIKLNPTILTFWLGNNDVLGYATSGGTKGSNLGISDPAGTLPTEAAAFKNMLIQALTALQTALPNTKVVVANIPDVTAIPFFNTVGPALPAGVKVYFKKKDGSVDSTDNADKKNHLLLSAKSVLNPLTGKGFIRLNPLESQYVLDADEEAIAVKAVIDFNAAIAEQVQQFNYTLVDINGFFTEVKNNSYMVAGETYTTSFITGGVFSLDGVHPSAKGQALIANQFLKAMNKAYGANIPFIDVTKIPGIKAPGFDVMKRNFQYSLNFKFSDDAFDILLRYL